MEVALTFGSLGDIIAICQLCVQLSHALGLGCTTVAGSAKEYQDLRKDLDLFVQILLQVVATYEQRENSLYLTELDNTTKAVVAECAAMIEEAVRHFGTRYHGSLQVEGSGKKYQHVYKKIEWLVREKERLLELREKLHRNTERLTLLNGLAARKSARVDNSTMLARIDEVHRLVSAEASCREEILRLLNEQHNIANRQADQLKAVNDQLVVYSRSNSDVLTSVKQSLAALVEIKETLAQVAKVVVSFQVSASSSMFFRFIDPTKELPVVVEDALGRPLAIPPEWIEFMEWNTFHCLLEDHSKGRMGQDMVHRRQYTLEEEVTGKDLNQNLPPALSLRRGMKINMSMIFAGNLLPSGTCPRCRTENTAPESTTIQCKKKGCGMLFRMDTVNREQAATFDFGYVSPPDVAAILSWSPSSNTPRASAQGIRAEPSDFLRVRFLSLQLKRARAYHKGPLSERMRLRAALMRRLKACAACRERKVKCSHVDFSLFEAAYRARPPEVSQREGGSQQRLVIPVRVPTPETQELYNMMRRAEEKERGFLLTHH